MPPEQVVVGVLMGSPSDRATMQGCLDTLLELKVPYEVRALSAHRTPHLVREYALAAAGRGLKVIIAGAGWAAHLAGVVAAHTHLPVIGVPIDSSPFKGFDALLATVQMPSGIPVATMAVGSGGAKNAAVFAAQILALADEGLAERLTAYRADLTRQAEERSWL